MITPLDQIPPEHPGRRFFTGDTTWFACQHDPRFSYGLHLPASYSPGADTPVVVAIHGTGRGAAALRTAWAPWSEASGAAIVAPLFPVGVSGPHDFNGYKAVENEGVRYDLALLAILQEVGQRWQLDTSCPYLFGHSGGGQLAQRLLLLHPRRWAGVAISAPGRITPIDPGREWPGGTADTVGRFGISVDPAAVASVPILLTAGAEDHGREDLAAQQDPTQTRFGTTRLERLATLAENLRLHGGQPTVRLVPAAGHAQSPTQGVVQAWLEQQIDHATTQGRGVVSSNDHSATGSRASSRIAGAPGAKEGTGSRTLGETASVVRSKNAGPFWMTIDAFFDAAEDYAAAKASPLCDPTFISSTYRVDATQVEIFTIDELLAIKVSFPRPVVQGSLGDTDQHSGQQYVALLEMEL